MEMAVKIHRTGSSAVMGWNAMPWYHHTFLLCIAYLSSVDDLPGRTALCADAQVEYFRPVYLHTIQLEGRLLYLGQIVAMTSHTSHITTHKPVDLENLIRGEAIEQTFPSKKL